MNIDDLLSAMTPDIYQRLLQAVETGKWADGSPLSEEQKANSLQAVMLWQARYNTQAQHMTIDTQGQMVIKSKRELKQAFAPQPFAMLKPE